MGYVSGLLAQQGVAVIVAAIAPHRVVRETVRSSHSTPFIEVFLECDLSERIRRDPKGIYAKALRGEIDGLTGLTAPYEPPICPDVHIYTDRCNIREEVELVLDVLARRQLI
jgi:adenylylsulfate kinase